MLKPITPTQAEAKRKVEIPEQVIEVVNDLLVKNVRSGYATIKLKEVLTLVAARMQLSRQTILDNGWMDFEALYRDYGWDVAYDGPAYCETYDGFYKFKKKKCE